MLTNLDYCGNELEVFSQARNWKKYWMNAIKDYLGDSVLDVGAGIGATAKVLNFKKYDRWVELEPDANLTLKIRQSQSLGELPGYYEIKNGISSDLDGEEQFDTVLYIDVLEHIEDDRGELLHISRSLVAGGHIIVVSPAHNYLYTEFDKQVGHYRRYNRNTLKEITPENFMIVKLSYLDSVGMLASLANRFFLKSDSPKIGQIRVWDGLMVPLSRVVDKLLLNRIGKSIVYIIKKSY